MGVAVGSTPASAEKLSASSREVVDVLVNNGAQQGYRIWPPRCVRKP